jgi:hypothetical protein
MQIIHRLSFNTLYREHKAYPELHNTTEYLLVYVVFQNTNFVVVILTAYLKLENQVHSGI